ncbi:hypothetical protein GCM10025870_01350 [Agromyces marinus]|uniref:Uncharacterized protein n=1 Tax=Agromyces marinus TaxID=1389020 RepID=A0ABN6Y6T0_9MICO|nr:hypothetical protein GCM10025870_01350 [Agromyces marinus]
MPVPDVTGVTVGAAGMLVSTVNSHDEPQPDQYCPSVEVTRQKYDFPLDSFPDDGMHPGARARVWLWMPAIVRRGGPIGGAVVAARCRQMQVFVDEKSPKMAAGAATPGRETGRNETQTELVVPDLANDDSRRRAIAATSSQNVMYGFDTTAVPPAATQAAEDLESPKPSAVPIGRGSPPTLRVPTGRLNEFG